MEKQADEKQKRLNVIREKYKHERTLRKIERRDLLLTFLLEKGTLAKTNEPVDRIQTMKGLFLLTQEVPELKGLFHFDPYLYGAVSYDVYTELDTLKAEGLVATTNDSSNDRWNRYFLMGKGMTEAKKAAQHFTKRTLSEIGTTKAYVTSKPMYEMLKEIYAKYPKYAKNSVIRF